MIDCINLRVENLDLKYDKLLLSRFQSEKTDVLLNFSLNTGGKTDFPSTRMCFN